MTLSQQFDVFVSYADEDLKYVDNVVTLLEEVGIRTWIDWKNIKQQQLTPEIQKGIDESRFFAFFESKHTKESAWLELEGKYFKETRGNQNPLPFVYIKLSDGQPPPSLADLCTRTTHCVRLNKSFIGGVIQLIEIFQGNDIHHKMGLLKFYASRGEVTPTIWDLLSARAGKEIRYMGHTMTPAFSEGRDMNLVLPALRRGVKMKVILLTPNYPKLQQIREVQTGVNDGINIQTKIRQTIGHIRELKHRIGDAGRDSKLQIRVTDKIMYSSVSIFDSLALVTNYSSIDEIGNNSPTFLVQEKQHGKGSLFDFYSEEFDRYWDRGNHPEEELRKGEFDDSSRIIKYKEQISQIDSWISGATDSLPPPTMMIMYPTYECWLPDNAGGHKLLCEHCMYEEMRKNPKSSQKHLDFEVLHSILDQSTSLGVRNFEFSGGGEPLQYKYISQLLELLSRMKTAHNSVNGKRGKPISFGLLTNGLYLTSELSDSIASVFSYVRFNYAEGIQGKDEIERIFVANLKALLTKLENRWSEPSIGLKLLLNKKNSATLVRNLLNIKRELGPLFNRINHIRIRAMRSQEPNVEVGPNDTESLAFKNEFFDHIFTNKDGWPKDIKVDLNLQYVDDNFKCHLNPLMALVDPAGCLLPCYNYMRDQKRLTIGNLESEQLSAIWGSDKHRKIVTDLDAQQVCNARNGCPCRFVRYQQATRSLDQAAACKLSAAIDGFL